MVTYNSFVDKQVGETRERRSPVDYTLHCTAMADDLNHVEESVLKILYDADGSPLGLADNGVTESNQEEDSATKKRKLDRKKRRKKRRRNQKEGTAALNSDEEIEEEAAANHSKFISSIKSLMKLPMKIMKWNKIKPQIALNEVQPEEKTPVIPTFHAPRVIHSLPSPDSKGSSNINSITENTDINNTDTISIEAPPLVPPSTDEQSITAEKTSFLNYFSYSKKSPRENTEVTDPLTAAVSDIQEAASDAKEAVVSGAEGVSNIKATDQSNFFNYFTFNSVDTTSIVDNIVKPFSISPIKATSKSDVDGNLSLIDALTKEKNALFQRTQELEEEIKAKEAEVTKKLKSKYDSILQERDTKHKNELSNKDILSKFDTDVLKKEYELKLKLANDMLSDYSSKYQGSVQEIDNLKGKCTVLHKNYSDLERSYASKQEELAVEKSEIELLLAADANMKKKLTLLNDDITKLRKHCGLKDKIIAELNDSLDTQTKIGKQQESDFKQQLEDALRQVEAAQKSKTVQDSSLNEKKDHEIKGLVLQLDKKDQEIKGLTLQLDKKDQEMKGLAPQVDKKDQEIKGLALQLDKKDREIKDLMQIIEELQGIANSVKNEAAAARDAPRDTPRDAPRDTPHSAPRDTPRSAPRAREEFEESKTTLSRTTGTELRAPHTPSTPSKGKFIRNPTPATTSSSASADPFDFSLMASLMSNVNKK